MILENLFENNINELLALLFAMLSVLSGLSIYFVLAANGNRWVKTYYEFMTFALLPLITFVISKVIASNIALSLGMVGALSIVRFRNPVKNSFQLVMYFLLITIGISYGVNWKWSLGITVFTLMLIHFSSKFRFEDNFSLDESLESYSLNLVTSTELDHLITNRFLRNYTKSEKNTNDFEHNYTFFSNSKDDMLVLQKKIQSEESKNIKILQINL